MKTDTEENLFYKERKGQSAIEYLMTYGWMLLVVAIVGGAIFATVQGQCQQSASGFAGDIEVNEFGVTEGDDLQVELRNTGSESVYVHGVELHEEGTDTTVEYNITDEDGETQEEEISDGETLRIGVASTATIDLADVTDSDGDCNNLDLRAEYNTDTLDNQASEGTLTDEFELA